MTNLSNLDTVSDLFPAYPRSELATRLLCANSVEDVIEELLVEQLKPPGSYDVSVYLLKDMFPSEPLDVLAAHLQRYHGDVEQCIDYLMKPDLGLRLSELTGLPIDKMSQKIKDVQTRSNTNGKSGTNSCQDTILLQALAEVIYNEGSCWSGRKIKSQTMSKTERELKLQIAAEKLLQRLNYNFLERSLQFFKNNMVKVLEVARLFTEAEMQLLTFSLDAKLLHNYMPLDTFNSNSPHLPNKARVVPSQAKAHNSMKENIRPNNYMPSEVRFSTHLDLHGYTVGEALSLANKTARAWWLEEQRLQLEEGLMHKSGSKASHLEYLVIVTGRGLHSVGGPKIKCSVLRLLTQQGYIVEEDIGRLIVMGKKKA